MKRIKSVNGYTIYEATTQRDAENYRCEIGHFNIYLSSDIRDFGLANSYPEYEDVEQLSCALVMACASRYAVACELAEEISGSTAQDMDLVLEIERRLDAGEALETVREELTACYLPDEELDLDEDDVYGHGDSEPEEDEDATCVYLRDLYEISPQAHVFIVTRADVYDLRITSSREYTGGKEDGDKIVWRVTPASYPMYKNVLEVEII